MLTVLGGQHLTPGYGPTYGTGTAHDIFRGLKQAADGNTLNKLPTYPPATLLFAQAWVASLKGRDAIYLNDVSGNLDLSQAGPAYLFG